MHKMSNLIFHSNVQCDSTSVMEIHQDQMSNNRSLARTCRKRPKGARAEHRGRLALVATAMQLILACQNHNSLSAHQLTFQQQRQQLFFPQQLPLQNWAGASLAGPTASPAMGMKAEPKVDLSDESRLLVCHYATKQALAKLPKDMREFVLAHPPPPATVFAYLNSLAPVGSPSTTSTTTTTTTTTASEQSKASSANNRFQFESFEVTNGRSGAPFAARLPKREQDRLLFNGATSQQQVRRPSGSASAGELPVQSALYFGSEAADSQLDSRSRPNYNPTTQVSHEQLGALESGAQQALAASSTSFSQAPNSWSAYQLQGPSNVASGINSPPIDPSTSLKLYNASGLSGELLSGDASRSQASRFERDLPVRQQQQLTTQLNQNHPFQVNEIKLQQRSPPLPSQTNHFVPTNSNIHFQAQQLDRQPQSSSIFHYQVERAPSFLPQASENQPALIIQSSQSEQASSVRPFLPSIKNIQQQLIVRNRNPLSGKSSETNGLNSARGQQENGHLASQGSNSSVFSSVSPLSSMFNDVFGAASHYLMRFKPSSIISQPAATFAALNSISNQILNSSKEQVQQQQQQHLSNSSKASQDPAMALSFKGSGGQQAAHGKTITSSLDRSSSVLRNPNFLSRLSLSPNSAESTRRDDVCGRTIQTPERRIIGGEGARYGEFPYQVHIKIAKHQCGGALVDRQSIVTAAHCVYHFITRAPVNKLQIVIGAYDIEDEQFQELPPQYFKVNKVKLHPSFRFSASHPDRYDIAILKLDKPVKYTDNVLPVCLPSKELKFESMVGTVTGFGKTDPSLSNRYGTRLLQKVDVPIIENNECERWHRTRGIDLKIFPEMMCAGYEDGLKDACVGDSGGPLVVKTPAGANGAFRWTLAGITSAGFGCAQSRQPGIYHRVSHTVDWILENLD